MLELEHNVTGILYNIQGIIDVHFAKQTKSEIAEADLKRIYTQTERALQIMKHLKRATKEEIAGRAVRNKVSAAVAWKKVLRLLRRELLFSGIQMMERIPECFPPICCDRSDFVEILYHLARNSVQAMKNQNGTGGNPRRLILRCELSVTACAEPIAVITLGDSGPGISERHLPKIFQPFFTTKKEGEGSGFGLYLTQQLVARNRGKIRLFSYPGQGTTFVIEFPLSRGAINRAPTLSVQS